MGKYCLKSLKITRQTKKKSLKLPPVPTPEQVKEWQLTSEILGLF